MQRWHRNGAFLILAVLLASVIALWFWLADPKESSSVLSGALGVVAGALIGLGTELFMRRLDQQEKLNAMAQLLWADLGMAKLRIERAPAEMIEQIDITLWKDMRVDLIQAGMPVQAMAKLTTVYWFAEKWNLCQSWLETTKTQADYDAALAELEELRQDLLGHALKTATDLLRPYVPEEIRRKVSTARTAAPTPESAPMPEADGGDRG